MTPHADHVATWFSERIRANHARAVRGAVDRLLGVLIAMLRSRTLDKPLATTTA
jgi:hypothetical protein